MFVIIKMCPIMTIEIAPESAREETKRVVYRMGYFLKDE
jgi:hypothetical protein